jgi:hypothetical protein
MGGRGATADCQWWGTVASPVAGPVAASFRLRKVAATGLCAPRPGSISREIANGRVLVYK